MIDDEDEVAEVTEDEDFDEDEDACDPPVKARKPRKKRDNTKEEVLVDLMRRPEGATVEQMMAATGWQGHTVRGCMSGSLKKKKGYSIVAERTMGQKTCVYRITGDPTPPTEETTEEPDTRESLVGPE